MDCPILGAWFHSIVEQSCRGRSTAVCFQYDAPVWSDSHNVPLRTSQDKVRNQFGDHLINFCQIFDLAILNGMCSQKTGWKVYIHITKWRYSVIDCVLLSHKLLALKKHLQVSLITIYLSKLLYPSVVVM